MKKTFLFYSLVTICLLAVACSSRNDAAEQAKESNEQKFDDNEQMEDVADFMVEAYNNNLLISEASELAARQAQSPQIAEFAQQSLGEHNKVKQQFETLASQMNITLPDSLAQDDRQMIEDLSSAKQEDFDKKYVDLVDDASEDLIKKFENVSKNVQNAELNNFFQQTLPALRRHQEQADQLEESV